VALLALANRLVRMTCPARGVRCGIARIISSADPRHLFCGPRLLFRGPRLLVCEPRLLICGPRLLVGRCRLLFCGPGLLLGGSRLLLGGSHSLLRGSRRYFRRLRLLFHAAHLLLGQSRLLFSRSHLLFGGSRHLFSAAGELRAASDVLHRRAESAFRGAGQDPAERTPPRGEETPRRPECPRVAAMVVDPLCITLSVHPILLSVRSILLSIHSIVRRPSIQCGCTASTTASRRIQRTRCMGVPGPQYAASAPTAAVTRRVEARQRRTQYLVSYLLPRTVYPPAPRSPDAVAFARESVRTRTSDIEASITYVVAECEMIRFWVGGWS
jgi:hypothetical protein